MRARAGSRRGWPAGKKFPHIELLCTMLYPLVREHAGYCHGELLVLGVGACSNGPGRGSWASSLDGEPIATALAFAASGGCPARSSSGGDAGSGLEKGPGRLTSWGDWAAAGPS